MKLGVKRRVENNEEVLFQENPIIENDGDSIARMNSGGVSDLGDLRMTTLSKRRSRLEPDQAAEEVQVVVSED